MPPLKTAAIVEQLMSLGLTAGDTVMMLSSLSAAGAAGKLPVDAGVGGGYKNMLQMAHHAEQAGVASASI